MKKVKTTTEQKIGLLLFSFVLTLLIIELGFAKLILLSVQRSGNRFDDDSHVYTILALGESTTAGGWNSWPVLLENTLNSKNLSTKFKVHNEGIGSVTTVYIVSKLEENIEKYNPDMVITMMGVNDGIFNVIYKEEKGLKSYMRDLNTYKIINYFLSKKDSEYQSITSNDESEENISKLSYLDQGFYFYNKGEKEMAKISFNKAIQENPNDDQAYVQLGYLYREQGSLADGKKMYLKALQINNTSAGAYHGLGWVYQKEGNLIEAEKMYNKSIYFAPDDSNNYFLLGALYANQNKLDKAKEILEKGLELNPKDTQIALWIILIERELNENVTISFKEYFDLDVVQNPNNPKLDNTRFHYQQLYKILKRKNIKYVAMLYPNLDIKPIKEFFSEEDQKDIIFISNNDNFEEALKNERYESFFTDSFGLNQNINSIFHGNFGHTTVKGNELIAENVANHILKELNKTID